jgi:hypothetical protein
MPHERSHSTPVSLRRGLYFGGIVYTVSGVVTLVKGIRQDVLVLALLGASWLAIGLVVSLLGDQRAQVQTPRAALIRIAIIVGAGMALVTAFLYGRPGTELPVMAPV